MISFFLQHFFVWRNLSQFWSKAFLYKLSIVLNKQKQCFDYFNEKISILFDLLSFELV